MPIYGSASLEWLASEAEFDESWRDAAVLYDAAADMRPTDEFLRLEAVRTWAYAGDCSQAEWAADLIEWCDLTGGLPPG